MSSDDIFKEAASYYKFYFADLSENIKELTPGVETKINLDRQEIQEIDWDSVSLEMAKLMASPERYLMWAQCNYERKLRELLANLDLNPKQFDILLGLMIRAKRGEVATQRQLATEIDEVPISKVLRDLEKKGLIVRGIHPKYTKDKSVIATGKGIATIRTALKIVVKFDEEYFSVLDDKAELIRQLKKTCKIV